MKITLFLRGYLTPSLNQLLHKHWTVAHREKLRARRALLFSLLEYRQDLLTQTILPEGSSLLWINCVIAGLSKTIPKRTLTSKFPRKKRNPNVGTRVEIEYE